jgi:hypothetical protein
VPQVKIKNGSPLCLRIKGTKPFSK